MAILPMLVSCCPSSVKALTLPNIFYSNTYLEDKFSSCSDFHWVETEQANPQESQRIMGVQQRTCLHRWPDASATCLTGCEDTRVKRCAFKSASLSLSLYNLNLWNFKLTVDQFVCPDRQTDRFSVSYLNISLFIELVWMSSALLMCNFCCVIFLRHLIFAVRNAWFAEKVRKCSHQSTITLMNIL